MTRFSSELSGSLIFNSASSTAELQPFSGGLNVSGSELYINEVALTTRLENIEAGNVGSASLLPLNLHSASINAWTASHEAEFYSYSSSTDSRLSSLEVTSGSQATLISNLTAATSSYLTKTGYNVISSSTQISASGYLTSESAALLGFGGDPTPEGTISSSAQIAAFGYITSSAEGTISSSTQIENLGFVSNNSTSSFITTSQTSSFITTSQTSSISVATASFATTATSASYISATNIDGTITNALTASYISAANIDGAVENTVSSSYSAFALTASYALSASHEISYDVSSSHAEQADSASYAVTASYIDPLFVSSSAAAYDFSFGGAFDGDRIVTNPYMGDMFSASFNAGTSSSLAEFIEKVFFTNTAPQFNFTGSPYYNIVEFNESGSTAFQLFGTDNQGDSFTFGTSSAYTDDYIRVASDGTVTLNVVPTEASFNTDNRGDGTLTHPVQVSISDVHGATSTQTIYLYVVPNTAPKFRETSVGGSVITSFNANRNENATPGEVTKIFFTDGENDSITIRTGSDANSHFSMSLHSNYVRIYQTTASLDYENITAYSMSITASDQHYEAAQDADSVTSIFVGVTVVDNIQPSINPQTLTGVNENSGNGTSAGTVTGTSDNEGDTITFSRFSLSSLSVNGTPVPTGSYGGTSQLLDPHENPFLINSSTGEVTRKPAVYLNSDLIDTYIYRAFVSDAYNATSSSALITIPIADDTPPSITGVQQFYAIESALAGNNVYDSSNGFSGTIADFNSNQAVTWTVKPTADFAVNSSGNLLLNRNISGSGDLSGTVLTGSVTASNSFNTETSATFSVNVTTNSAPDITFTNTSANQNTNLGRSGSTLVTLTFSDTESDTINYAGVIFEGTGSQLNAVQSGTSWLIQAKENLSASTYTYTASVDDEHSFRTNTETDSFTIAQADDGTLSQTNAYIIESAVSGALIRRVTDGLTGNQSYVSVSYSPSYGSPSVQSYTSSNAAIAVTSNGYLSLATNLSGSATASGDTITSDITFRDQYDNVGSGSITVNVAANAAPTATFTNQTAALTASISTNTYLVGVSITDDESDTPYSMSLSGTDASYLKAVPQNANSSSYQIQASTTISSGGTYNYSASVFDNFGKQTDYNRSFTVSGTPAQWFAYLDEGGVYATDESNALLMLGDANDDGTPDAGSLLENFTKGNFGSGTITNTLYSAYGIDYAFEVGSGYSLGGSNSTPLLSNLNQSTGSQSNAMFVLIFPSGAAGFTNPSSIALATGGSTSGEYVLFGDRVGTGPLSDSPQSAFIRYYDFSGSVTYPQSSETRFGVIFTQGDASSNITYFLMASSGSNPTSTQ